MKLSVHISRNVITGLCSFVLFKTALDLSYYYLISNIWGYAALTVNLNWTKLIESYLLLVIVFVFLPKDDDRLSNTLIFFLVLISYIPLLTIFALKDEPRLFIYAVTVFWLMVFFCQDFPSCQYDPSRTATVSASPSLL